jgi:hypothetical protein
VPPEQLLVNADLFNVPHKHLGLRHVPLMAVMPKNQLAAIQKKKKLKSNF